ncbi:hypothetical protein H7097_03940 [Aeromicrobium sp.]|nr:hypothetical protein [Candidatus Saccharibacteria bacterium]
MGIESVTNFPKPQISKGFYAGYILLSTLHSGEPLVVSGGATAEMLERETQALRGQLAQATPRDHSKATKNQIRRTLHYSLCELSLIHREDIQHIGDANIPTAYEYLNGPVEIAGIEMAKHLGWHKGATPMSPFNDLAQFIEMIRDLPRKSPNVAPASRSSL